MLSCHLLLFGLLVGAYVLCIDSIVRLAVEKKVFEGIKAWIPDLQMARSQNSLMVLVKAKISSDYAFELSESNGSVLYDSNASQKGEDLARYTSHKTLAFCNDLGCYTLKVHFNYQDIAVSATDLHGIYTGVAIVGSIIFIVLSTAILLLFSWPAQRLFRMIKAAQKENIQEVIDAYKDGTDEAALFAATLHRLSTQICTLEKGLIGERQRCHMILESLVEGIIAVDSHLSVIFANLPGAKLFGMPKAHLVGANIMHVEPKYPSAVSTKCQALISETVYQHVVRTDSVTVGQNSKMHIDIVAIPLGMEKGAILILQDNSDHHKVLSMGKEFIANASHELRTPITIIKGFAEMLHDLPEISDAMLADITDKILRNCQRMSTLVKSLLVLADLETPLRGTLEDREIAVVLENCAHQILNLYPDIDLKLNLLKEPVCVHIDSSLIELALMNLLENAIKYSSSKAQVIVSVQENQDDVIISVSDQGMGIQEKDLSEIFNRFYTVNKSRSRKLGGAGLGLSIVRTIVEKHEGHIDVTSTFGVGSTFIINLPKAKSLAMS